MRFYQPGRNGRSPRPIFSPVRYEISSKEGVRVLIADDERTFAMTFAGLVKSCGHEVVDVVFSGLEAIRSYHRCHPDVVLMDFNMARLNGLTACRNILSTDPSGRIIFLTGLTHAADLEPPLSGAIASLKKPIKVQELEAVLLKLQAAPAQPVNTGPPTGLS